MRVYDRVRVCAVWALPRTSILLVGALARSLLAWLLLWFSDCFVFVCVLLLTISLHLRNAPSRPSSSCSCARQRQPPPADHHHRPFFFHPLPSSLDPPKPCALCMLLGEVFSCSLSVALANAWRGVWAGGRGEVRPCRGASAHLARVKDYNR